jgi:phage FluMu protein Com
VAAQNVAVGRTCPSCGQLVTLVGTTADEVLSGQCPSCKQVTSQPNAQYEAPTTATLDAHNSLESRVAALEARVTALEPLVPAGDDPSHGVIVNPADPTNLPPDVNPDRTLDTVPA